MSEANALFSVLLERPEATARVGEALGQLCRAGDVLALEGELGAGKTSLVRGLASGLGLDAAAVASPTFVRMVEHEPAVGSQSPWLVHVDAYRLSGPGELEELGWGPELLADSVVAVEWASRVRELLPATALSVELRHAAGRGRLLSLGGGEGWASRIQAHQRSLRAAAGSA